MAECLLQTLKTTEVEILSCFSHHWGRGWVLLLTTWSQAITFLPNRLAQRVLFFLWLLQVWFGISKGHLKLWDCLLLIWSSLGTADLVGAGEKGCSLGGRWLERQESGLR